MHKGKKTYTDSYDHFQEQEEDFFAKVTPLNKLLMLEYHHFLHSEDDDVNPDTIFEGTVLNYINCQVG